MPHDRSGNPVRKGDRVTMVLEVKDVYAGEVACNASFQVVIPDGSTETYSPFFTCNAGLATKFEPVAFHVEGDGSDLLSMTSGVVAAWSQGRPTHCGPGLAIAWQDGPVPASGERNGAQVEDVLEAAQARLLGFQDGAFPCEHNQRALAALSDALEALYDRTAERTARGVEGTLTA